MLLVGQKLGDEVVAVRETSPVVLAGVGDEERQGQRRNADVRVDRDDRGPVTGPLRHRALMLLRRGRDPLLHDRLRRRVRAARIQLQRRELSFV